MINSVLSGSGAHSARRRARGLAGLCVALGAALGMMPFRAGAATGGGHDPSALIRFDIELKDAPTDPRAGYIVELPDGGILPEPYPLTVVHDEQGNRLEHGCLWHDRNQALALVFAPPAQGRRVCVCAGGGTRLNAWKPESGLCPGVLAYMARGESLDAARRLADRFPPGKGVFFMRVPDVGIGNLPYGLPGSFADYVLGYAAPKQTGNVWIAVESKGGGAMEAQINGRRLNPKSAFPQKSGSVGEWVQCAEAPLRIEVFGFRPKNQAGNQLAWRTPGMTNADLGGPSPVHKGLPMWAARPIKPDECLRSGTAVVANARFQDGTPVPAFTCAPEAYLWFAEQPLFLCKLEARAFDNPEQTSYAWSFGDSAALNGPKEVLWIFEGFQDYAVSLTVSSKGKQRRCTCVFPSFCSGEKAHDIGNDQLAERFRSAFANALRAAPPNRNPAAAWTPSMWDLYFRLATPVRHRDMLEPLFGPDGRFLPQDLDDQQRKNLEDMYFVALCAEAPKRALAFARARQKTDVDATAWIVREAELLMYHGDNMDLAKSVLTPLLNGTTPDSVRARIRMGDMALLAGDYNSAVRIYGAVQNKVDHQKAAAADSADSAGPADPRERPPKKAPARTNTVFQAGAPAGAVQDWRVGAVRDTAVSETARSLIRQDYYDKAAKALSAWELEFPLSKINADYIVVEAMLLMKLADYTRAGKSLQAYCRAVDVTNYLADAMEMALTCMMRTGASKETVDRFVADMKEKLKYHPLADRLETSARRLESERKGVGQ